MALPRARPVPPIRLPARAPFWPRHWLTVALSALMLLAAIYCVALYLDQQAQIAQLEAEAASLGRQWKAEQEKAAQLREEIARLNSDAYIEQVARQQLGMIKPGEVPYMAVEPRSPKLAP